MGWARKQASNVVNIVEDIAKPVIKTIDEVVVKPVVDTVGDVYMEVRDPLQAAAVVAGNYVLPGSSLISSQLVSDGAKDILASDLGQVANLASGVSGGVAGNLSAGTQAGQAAGLTGNAATLAGNTALTAAATGDISQALTSGAIGAAGGALGSTVYGATGSQTLGQLAGNTGAGLLSGNDLGASLTNAAINTGATAAAGGLMNAINPPAADPYTVGGVYGPDNIDVGGGFNPSGISVPATEGATLGSVGAAAETPTQNPNLVNSAGTGILAGLIKSLFTGSSPTGTGNMATTQENNLLGSLLGGSLTSIGGLMQGGTSAEAAQAQANALRQAGQQASTASQFRPVGTTTTFGTSNFQVDPTTGQLQSAGYNLSPQLQQYQNTLMAGGQQSLTDAANLQNLGRGYIAQSPEAAAQQYMASQQALLAPSRDMESARLANQLQQTGRTGVSVAQGGSLGMANPEQQALANARAIQDLNLAAQAQQQGRAQTTFGQGLLTGAYDPFNAGLKSASTVEGLGQQPFGLSTDLAKLSSAAGANSGRLGLAADMSAADAALKADQYNPYATATAGLGGSSLFGRALGNVAGNTGIGSSLAKYLGGLGGYDYNALNTAASNFINANPDIIPSSTFSGGGADMLDADLRALLGL